LIYFIVLATSPGVTFGTCFLFIVLYVVLLLPQMITLRFPFFFFHHVCKNERYDKWRSFEGYESEPEQHFSAYMFTPRMRTFRGISLVMTIIVIALCVAIPAVMVFAGSLTRQYRPIPLPSDYVHDTIPRTGPSEMEPSDMCVVEQYGLSMIDITALAAFVYYDFKPGDNLSHELLTEYFDPEVDSRMEVTAYELMDLSSADFASAAWFNFARLNLTVFSIRGTIDPSDVALDAQFFMSSLFLTVAMPLAVLVSSITPQTMTAIRGIMSFPVTMMKPVTLIDKYMKVLQEYYETVPKLPNVLFTGHSLGGGFAKVFGYIYGRQSVAVSGPGISLYLKVYEPQQGVHGDSTLVQTDIIPDHDIVPRVEVSGGVGYRVFCGQGVACHARWHTLCMMGIMCGIPHEKFCRSITEGNLPKIYDSMVELAQTE
jgi:lipase ATG15